ncbi:MAG: aminotransferase class V-fold PLP-dependent enzyme [Acidimicrobiales bacterium]|nr:aminotransferase class V-fold PLP-dependent enzyme [Acidimicrobiales bacterium]
MSLRFGKPMVSIPGPSTIPDRVLNAMHRPMPNIYEGELVDIAYELHERLPAIARTEGRVFITIGNGHAGWQMAINNTLSRGDHVLVLESGRFAQAWGEMATLSGVKAEFMEGSMRGPVDIAAFADRIDADIDRSIKAVMVVLTDTATSVMNDIESLGRVLNDADHPALFMVDAIASLGCDVFEMDRWGVDVTVAASQKGLMVPPGIAFCWVSPKALDAYATADLRTGYFDWAPRMKPKAMYELFAGTPPIQHLYGLREALDMIDEEGGLDVVWARHAALADSVRAAVAAWSTDGGIAFNITDPDARSNAVTTALTGSIDPNELRARAEAGAGLTLGLGIGGMADAIRIGHMGHLNPPHILGTLGTVEAALRAMGAPLGGSGAEAAARSIGGHL